MIDLQPPVDRLKSPLGRAQPLHGVLLQQKAGAEQARQNALKAEEET
jgi:hypothetical protein